MFAEMNKIPRPLAPAANFLARHSALVALALFAVAGAAVFDDYGVAGDDAIQRKIGYASFNYILGDESGLEEIRHNKFYGVAFEVPLTAAERVLGLEDSRDIHLLRRLFSHLFFLAGGLFAWLLARGLFGSRLVALFAMLLFLLHPRIYAHSFFNSKDLPFLCMFMVALYLTHRAFRRETVWAFALCGAGAALLVNLRIMGLTLFAAVLGMMALDAALGAKSRREGRRELARAGAFCAAFCATLYAFWPMLWRDPLNLAEAVGALSQHPSIVATLFRGELVRWPNLPWDYVPTWTLTTTPPAVIILAALGIGYLARLCADGWRDAFRNTPARFGLLAAVCMVLPVAAAIALDSNLYDGWRHMYFLYAPICVLAAFGLRALAAIPQLAVRAGAFAAAALGISLTVVQMVGLHPYQNDYFNALVDKSGLAERWEMDYWGLSYREALATLLETRPNERVSIAGYGPYWNVGIIPADKRRRLHINPNFASYRIIHKARRFAPGDGRDGAVDERSVIWTREIYGVPVISVLDARAESESAFLEAYAAARASRPDASGGGFDIYADGDNLIYAKDGCGEDDARGRFGVSVFPVSQDDLPQAAADAGLESQPIYFDFHSYGAMRGGKCAIIRDLPDYPISHVETWRQTSDEGRLWSAIIVIDESHERYRRALASLPSAPAARSGFDLYLDGDTLTYVKDGCADDDARGRFFLSVFPANPRDLPQAARDAGFEHEPLNFDFARHGAIFDGKCVIIRRLPNYPISRIETGQWLPGEGELWSGRIVVGD